MNTSTTAPERSVLPRLLSATQAAEILGIKPETVRFLARLSPEDPAYLPAVRIGSGTAKPRVLIHPDDLSRYIEDRRGTAS